MQKRLFKHIILISGLFLFVNCRSDYEEKNGKIYFNWIHGGNLTKKETLIKDADAKTFETIKHNVKLKLGKDKNYVFYRARKIQGVDPETFKQVKDYFWKDKNKVYYLNHGLQNYIVNYADPKSFTVFDFNVWGKDKNFIFHKSSKNMLADLKSFKPINENWGKDNFHYYWKTKRLDSLDYKSTEIVKTYFKSKQGEFSYYIKDKNYVYFKNKIVAGANPRTFIANGIGSFGNDGINKFDWGKNKGIIDEKYRETYYIKK